MDNKALFKLSYGVFVIGVKSGEKLNGCVANTAVQVTSEPAKMSVTLNKNNYTTNLILKSGQFSISVMEEDVSMETIGNFGFKTGKTADKFASVNYKTFAGGTPYITDGINAAILCKVESSLDVGSHIIIVGEIVDAITLSDKNSLTYADYHKLKNGVTPPNAPSYVPPQEEVKGYKCSVCGYIYKGEPLPPDFICPICGQPASVFKKL